MSAEPSDAQIESAQNFAQSAGGSIGFDYLMANSQEERGEILANDASLEYEEWKDLESTVVEVRKQQLNLVSDLREAGLTSNEDLATLVTRWQTVDSISEDADIAMNPNSRSDEEQPGYGLEGVPLPIFTKDWRIDRRFLMNSRNGPGGAIDTTVAAQMTRALSNTIEDTMLNGWNRPVDGYTMPGFLNHSDRNQVTGSSWHDGTNDPDNVREDLLAAIEALENDEYTGGNYWLYLSRNEWQRLRSLIADFGSGAPGDTNMRTRIQEEFDAELGRVRVSKNIPAGEAILFEPSQDVVELGVAEDIQPIEWEDPTGWELHMKLFAAMNLKLRSTADGQMGVCHLSGLS